MWFEQERHLFHGPGNMEGRTEITWKQIFFCTQADGVDRAPSYMIGSWSTDRYFLVGVASLPSTPVLFSPLHKTQHSFLSLVFRETVSLDSTIKPAAYHHRLEVRGQRAVDDRRLNMYRECHTCSEQTLWADWSVSYGDQEGRVMEG